MFLEKNCVGEINNKKVVMQLPFGEICLRHLGHSKKLLAVMAVRHNV